MWLFIMVPSPGAGRFTVTPDRMDIERLIKDLGLFNNEPEDSKGVSLPHQWLFVCVCVCGCVCVCVCVCVFLCQLHWNHFV